MQTISIDFGGTVIKMASICDGKLIEKRSILAYSKEGLKKRLSCVEKEVRALLSSQAGDFLGIGIAMPGLIDQKTGRVTEIYEKYEDSIGFDLASWCEEKFHLPMKLEMDSKAALLGEMQFGRAKGYENVVIVIIGTGVGTAVAINGKLLQSKNSQAGVLGSHMIIEKNGRKCTCPGQGCLEAYVGGWAIPNIIREHKDFANSMLADKEELDYKNLIACYQAGDKVAFEVFSEVIEALRAGVISLIHAYDPELVLLSGGVMQAGEEIRRPLCEGINRFIWGSGKQVLIQQALLPEDSVLLGLHALFL